MDPSEGSYLILKEWYENCSFSPSSMYLSACRVSVVDHAGRQATDRCNAANSVVVALDRDLDSFDVLFECKSLEILVACGISPVATIKQGEFAADVLEILFNDREQL